MIPKAKSFAAVKNICTWLAVSTLIMLIAAKTTKNKQAINFKDYRFLGSTIN